MIHYSERGRVAYMVERIEHLNYEVTSLQGEVVRLTNLHTYYKQKNFELASQIDCDVTHLQHLMDTRARISVIILELMRVMDVDLDEMAEFIGYHPHTLMSIMDGRHSTLQSTIRHVKRVVKIFIKTKTWKRDV